MADRNVNNQSQVNNQSHFFSEALAFRVGNARNIFHEAHVKTIHERVKHKKAKNYESDKNNKKFRYLTPHLKNDEHTVVPISNEHNIKTEFVDTELNIVHSDIEIKEEPV